METGENIYIRNNAGVLNVKVEKEICLRDVMYGIGEDKLPTINRPRLEFHKRKCGDILVTLFDQTNAFPSNIYLVFIQGEEIKAFIGRLERDEEEDNSFTTLDV